MDPLTFSAGIDTETHVVVGVVAVGAIGVIDALGLSGSAVTVELVVGGGVEGTDAEALEGVWVEESATGAGLDADLQGL